MRRSTRILTLLIIFILAIPAGAVDLTSSESFKNYNFAIIKTMFNGTVGTSKALDFASMEEPLVITNAGNQTIAINIREWGIDTSRAGAIFSVSNGTGPGSMEYLIPLQRFGWGSQINEVSFKNIKVQVGMTEIFRGRTKEFVKLCVVVRKPPAK